MGEPWYSAVCPHCWTNLAPHESTLAEIIQYRQLPSTGEPFLVFVCQDCTWCFPWDYRNRKAVGQLDEPYRKTKRPATSLFSVIAECGKEFCDAQVELVAIRPYGTTAEQFFEEQPTWKAEGVRCGRGHPIVVPTRAPATTSRVPRQRRGPLRALRPRS